MKVIIKNRRDEMIDSKFREYSEYIRYSSDEMKSKSTQFLTNIKRRRTIREFSDSPIPFDVIANCVKAAATAPNGANKQPWHFVIISDSDVKRKIRKEAEKIEMEFYSRRASKEWLQDLKQFSTNWNKPFLESAPYLIAVFAEKYSLDENNRQEKNYYVMESVGMACGFLIAALHHCGVATLTHTPSPMNFLSELCNRPSNEKPYLLIVVGIPKDGVQIPDISKKSFEEVATIL